MRIVVRLVWTLGAACAAMILGCGGAHTPRESRASYSGPVGSTDIAHGEQVFGKMCAGCHPSGRAGVGPAIRGLGWSPARMRQQIREGEERMPPFPEARLSSTDLEAALAYLQTLDSVR